MGTILELSDALQNDSNKDFTWAVPVRVLWVQVTNVTTATAGNRTLGLEVFDLTLARILFFPMAEVTQAASLTRYYSIAANVRREPIFYGPTGVADNTYSQIPRGLYIRAGWILRIRDFAAIDVAADDMTVFGQVEAD